MKERYFTSDTIQEKSREMLNKLKQYRHKHDINFTPEHSALIILDMQRYFLHQGSHAFIPSALSIVPKIKDLLHTFLKLDLPIILTRHLNKAEDAKLMRIWWNDLITEESVMSEIIPEMNFPGTTIVKKTQYDAFYQTPLENLLRENGVTQVVITGVMTHLCCETTARSAFVKGFTVFFPIDGTATYNEDFHRATLLNLSHGFAIPVLIEELQDALQRYRCEH